MILLVLALVVVICIVAPYARRMARKSKLIHVSDPALFQLMKTSAAKNLIVVTTVKTHKRFLQSLLDGLMIYVLYKTISVTADFPDFSSDSYSGPVYDPTAPISMLIISVIYFYAFEEFTGTTPGKRWMKHYLINAKVEKVNSVQVFSRSLGRLVPFDAFSALGNYSYAFHDQLSGTFVVNKEEYDRLRALMNKAVDHQDTKPE